MDIFLWRSSQRENISIATKYILSFLILLLFFFYCLLLQPSYANDDHPQSVSQNIDDLAGILNPFNSTCYDWRGNIISCDLKRPYAEIMFGKSMPDSRFTDNKDGTVIDNMTKLVWLIPDVSKDRRGTGRFWVSKSMPNSFNFSALA
jgi:hypothetical protein